MNIDLLSKNRLRGDECPHDLKVLVSHCSDILNKLGVEVVCDEMWSPWTDKS